MESGRGGGPQKDDGKHSERGVACAHLHHGPARVGVSVAGPMTPQRSGVRAHVRARSGCAGVGGTRRRPRGAGRLARTDLNCPGGARSVSRAHSAAGAPTQIRGWAHARELAPAAGEGGGFTARRGALSCVRAGARAPNPTAHLRRARAAASLRGVVVCPRSFCWHPPSIPMRQPS